MLRSFRKRIKKEGAPPGHLEAEIPDTKIDTIVTVLEYTQNTFSEKHVTDYGQLKKFKEKPPVAWINVKGVNDPKLLESIGRIFKIHPLILEDINTVDQRPKIEDQGEYIYLVVRMIDYVDGTLSSDQISFILNPSSVISFQEHTKDHFDGIRKRLQQRRGQIRNMGSAYLLYALVDIIVDHYFSVLEKISEVIEELEDDLIDDPSPMVLGRLHQTKRDLIVLRKSVWPLRDVISRLERTDSPLFQQVKGLYLRDVYDHTIQVLDTLETFRDMISGMLDVYLSSISNKMNEIMKVLTIISTVFIPATFIAGLYGMNFHFMPELEVIWAYPLVLLTMLISALIMILYFKKRQWF